MISNMTGREVPTKYVELLVLKEVKKLTFKERLKLILGYNLLFEARITTQHKVGRTRQSVKVELTELEKTPPTTTEELSRN